MLKRSFAMIGVAALLAGGVIGSASSAAVRIVPTKIVSVNKFVGHVFFAPGSSDLGSDDKAFLQKLSKTHAKATLLGVVGYVQAGGSTANDISLSLARANSVADYLRSVGFKPNIRTAGRGAHPTVKNSPLARRVTIYATYRFSTGGGSTGGGTSGGGSSGGGSPCGDTPPVFLTHVIFSTQATSLDTTMQSSLTSALKASSNASLYGVIGYVPVNQAMTADLVAAKSRAMSVAVFMRQAGFDGRLKVYARAIQLDATNPLAHRVSIYVSYPISKLANGKCPSSKPEPSSSPSASPTPTKTPTPKPTPTKTPKPTPSPTSRGIYLSGTFRAISSYTADDIYMTGATISGPLSKSLTTPADISDGDNEQFWKFSRLKVGTYLVTIKMHVNSTGGCLTLFAHNGDGTATYNGIDGGWNIDPTDEFCDAESDFEVYKTITVPRTVTGQDFTFGFADCFNQDICFGI